MDGAEEVFVNEAITLGVHLMGWESSYWLPLRLQPASQQFARGCLTPGYIQQ